MKQSPHRFTFTLGIVKGFLKITKIYYFDKMNNRGNINISPILARQPMSHKVWCFLLLIIFQDCSNKLIFWVDETNTMKNCLDMLKISIDWFGRETQTSFILVLSKLNNLTPSSRLTILHKLLGVFQRSHGWPILLNNIFNNKKSLERSSHSFVSINVLKWREMTHQHGLLATHNY